MLTVDKALKQFKKAADNLKVVADQQDVIADEARRKMEAATQEASRARGVLEKLNEILLPG